MSMYYVSSDMGGFYISHHGIKGQKWGIKNGPPYPLNKSPLGKSEPLTSESLKKYASQYSNLRHVRVGSNTKGCIYTKNGKVTGMINTENKSDGHTWIQGLEVFGDSKGRGASYELLNKAVSDYGADRLSVRNTNKIAKHVYEKSGWETYKDDGFMSYLKFKKEVAPK